MKENHAPSTVSGVLASAMAATEHSNKPVDVVHDPSNNILPVPWMTAMVTEGSPHHSPRIRRSSSQTEPEIASFEFAKAIATGNTNGHAGTRLLSWNEQSGEKSTSPVPNGVHS